MENCHWGVDPCLAARGKHRQPKLSCWLCTSASPLPGETSSRSDKQCILYGFTRLWPLFLYCHPGHDSQNFSWDPITSLLRPGCISDCVSGLWNYFGYSFPWMNSFPVEFYWCCGDSFSPVRSSSCFSVPLSGFLCWEYKLKYCFPGNVSHMQYNIGKNR